jgi:hypothetical protein
VDLGRGIYYYLTVAKGDPDLDRYFRPDE